MRLALIVLAFAATARTEVAAKDWPTTVAFGGAAFQLPSSGSQPAPGVERVKYGPKSVQVVSVRTQSWHHREVTYTLTVTMLTGRLETASPEAVLAGLRRGLLGPPGTGGEAESWAAREVSGHAGFELKIRAGRQRVRARVAVGDGRVVQLTAVGSERAVTTDAVTKSLDSLAFADSDEE